MTEEDQILEKGKECLAQAVKLLDELMENENIVTPHISLAQFTSLTMLQAQLFVVATIKENHTFTQLPQEVMLLQIIQGICDMLNIKIEVNISGGVH